MNNEPFAWVNLDAWDKNEPLEKCISPYKKFEFCIPLYTQQRPHNTVLVPCDKLAEMQAEIEALKAEIKIVDTVNLNLEETLKRLIGRINK